MCKDYTFEDGRKIYIEVKKNGKKVFGKTADGKPRREMVFKISNG